MLQYVRFYECGVGRLVVSQTAKTYPAHSTCPSPRLPNSNSFPFFVVVVVVGSCPSQMEERRWALNISHPIRHNLISLFRFSLDL